MWHEARRREKDIQKLFNDHKKRAEKRREENPTDPNSLLLVNGIKSKINLDLNIYKQAAKSLVVWQGDQTTTIDRFDVRGTLSCLPDAEEQARPRRDGSQKRTKSTVLDASETESMRKLLNFERYRLLIQGELDKVSEDTRLRLVGKSEYLSEAKMKKLENNWFGTSGEASISNQYSTSTHRASTNHHHHQQPRSQGAAIGYNYSQALPMLPQCNSDEPRSQDSDKSTRQTVVDLDEYGSFDLDSVEKSRCDSNQTSEITKRYGLSCDEFDLLSETDKNAKSTKDIMNSLQDLKNKRKISKASHPSEQSSDQKSYGSDFPPEMLEDSGKKPRDDKDRCSSGNSTPVRQRSPSGANIILRCTDTVDGMSKSPTPPSFSLPPSSRVKESSSSSPPPSNHRFVPIAISLAKEARDMGSKSMQDESNGEKAVVSTCDRKHEERTKLAGPDRLKSDHNKTIASTMIPINLYKKETNCQPANDSLDKLSTEEKRVHDSELDAKQAIPEDSSDTAAGPRRAETPLAYKRYRRSSRSLSRDRRSSSRHKSLSGRRKRRLDSSRNRSRSASRSVSGSRSSTSDGFSSNGSNSVSSSYSSSDSHSSASISSRPGRSRSRTPIRSRPRRGRGRRRTGRRRARRTTRPSSRTRSPRRSSYKGRHKSPVGKSQSSRNHHRSRSRSR